MNAVNSAIHANELTKKFGDFTAVAGVSFEVLKGEIFGFLGPNGSGKTTTIRMMLGLLRPTAGGVNILGMAVDGDTSQIRRRVGYMSQRFSLYNDLTVMQNLNFYGRAYGLSNTQLRVRVKEALKMSDLENKENTPTKELSGGWRQRLALSAAIIHRPEILFLDEPTAGVDPVSRRAFWNLLYEQAAQGVTVFVTTHYMDEAEHCQKLAFIQHGKITAFGSPEQIKQEKIPGKVYEIVTSDVEKTLHILRTFQREKKLPIEGVELFGPSIHVVVQDMKNIKPALKSALRQAGNDPGEITVIEPSLEDIFIASMR